jgi:predicted transcriptional regulator of viral defense system
MIHCAKELDQPMPTTRSLSAVLDAAESSGKLNLRMEEIQAALPDVSAQALRQALHRQQRRGRFVRLSRGSGHWLIVPLRHATVGARPLETWLDRYLSKTLRIPYYVALLSAAELYGTAPYAVMVTQVMVAERRRAITVGRHELVFHTHARITAPAPGVRGAHGTSSRRHREGGRPERRVRGVGWATWSASVISEKCGNA